MNIQEQVSDIISKLQNGRCCMQVFVHEDRLMATPKHRPRAEKILEHCPEMIVGYYTRTVTPEKMEEDVQWRLENYVSPPVQLWGL